MKNCRFLKVIVALILLLLTLTGCVQKDVTVLVSHTERVVTIYTDKECVLDLTIKIKDGVKTDTITKTFELIGDETISLEINNFVPEFYDENAIIIEASNGQPQYTESQESIMVFLGAIGTAIALLVVGVAVGIIIVTIDEKKKAQHQN